MIMHLLALVLCGLSAAADVPPVASIAPPAFPVPTAHHLENGLPVWILARPEVPLVRVELSLRGGLVAARDPLALQLAGVLLTDGTRSQSGAGWQAAMGDLGARTSLGVGTFRAWGDVEVLTGDEDAALALLAAALRDPVLPRDSVVRARENWMLDGEGARRSTDAVVAAARTRVELSADHPLGGIWGVPDYPAAHALARAAGVASAPRDRLACDRCGRGHRCGHDLATARAALGLVGRRLRCRLSAAARA